jgi:hypothetical protein
VHRNSEFVMLLLHLPCLIDKELLCACNLPLAMRANKDLVGWRWCSNSESRRELLDCSGYWCIKDEEGCAVPCLNIIVCRLRDANCNHWLLCLVQVQVSREMREQQGLLDMYLPIPRFSHLLPPVLFSTDTARKFKTGRECRTPIIGELSIRKAERIE